MAISRKRYQNQHNKNILYFQGVITKTQITTEVIVVSKRTFQKRLSPISPVNAFSNIDSELSPSDSPTVTKSAEFFTSLNHDTPVTTGTRVQTPGASRKRPRTTAQMFDTACNWKMYFEIIQLISSDVCEKMYEQGMIHDFCSLLKLINEDRFPMDSITYLLLEVVRWYSLESTTEFLQSEFTVREPWPPGECYINLSW